MKRHYYLCLLFSLSTVSIFAQHGNVVEKAKYFLTADDLPDVITFLPEAPKPSDPIFYNDSCVYEEGKRLRDTKRGQLAVADTSITIRYIMQRFGRAMKCDLTPEKYPILSSFLYRTYATARLSITKAKDYYHRQRPYQYFNEHTPVPSHEDANDWTSYPSGHTIRFWTSALLLASIAPEHQNEIFKTGYELGQSRAIVGYHYQSDLDAARLVAGTVFARLMASPQWRKEYKKAAKEYKKKSRMD
jgi:acid phosphatase (class A)